MRLFLIAIISLLINSNTFAQGCCSGGASSPIAGGAATGVLQENQMEISVNYQFNESNTFFTGDTKTDPEFSNITSDYLFFRTDYGLSKKLTLSIASGYFLNKLLTDTSKHFNYSSSGLGDLIVFPRYSIYNKTANFKRTEIALGLGAKIPLGIHNDSSLTDLANSWAPGYPAKDALELNPPTVQTTSGSNDLMFYLFFFREYQKRKLRIFMTALHVNKGYNPSGIKFGNYTSVGLFASKTFFYRWGVTTQVKAENIDQIKIADNNGSYSIDSKSTGSKKWFFIPQLSYSQNGLTVFATSEIPLYQYLNGTQVGSHHQFTVGVNYRFLTKECEDPLTPIN